MRRGVRVQCVCRKKRKVKEGMTERVGNGMGTGRCGVWKREGANGKGLWCV